MSPPTDPAREAAAERRRFRRWIVFCVLMGGVLWISTLAEIPARSALRGYDNTFNYLWLRSAIVDGDWDFRNDLQECNTLTPEYRAASLALPITPAGRIPNKYGVGWAVLTIPSYVAADGVVRLGQATGLWELKPDGWNGVYQGFIQAGHLALAVAALLLAMRTIQRWLGVSGEIAGAGVLMVWAASPLLYYQTANLSMSHGTAFFAVTLLAYAVAQARDRAQPARFWLLAGLGWGLAVTTRYQLGVFGLLAAWGFFERLRRGEPVLKPVLCFALGAVPWLVLQVWAWRVVYGRWLVFSYGAEGESFHWLKPAWAQSLFSPWHGLLYWHPFLLLAGAGLAAWAWRVREGIAWVLFATVAATAYVNAAWWCWWFGSAFGNRSYDAALLPLMAGMAWLLKHAQASPRWTRLIWSAAGLCSAWNFYLVVLYRTGAISRSAPVTWWEMLESAKRLPEALRF